MFEHPCGKCNNNSCNNGHAFDQSCPLLIEHEKKVLAKNIENTEKEFAQMEKSKSYPVINARIRK